MSEHEPLRNAGAALPAREPDALLERYQDALQLTAEDAAEPPERVRNAVLLYARSIRHAAPAAAPSAAAEAERSPYADLMGGDAPAAPAEKAAANDARWRIAAVAGVALAAFAVWLALPPRRPTPVAVVAEAPTAARLPAPANNSPATEAAQGVAITALPTAPKTAAPPAPAAPAMAAAPTRAAAPVSATPPSARIAAAPAPAKRAERYAASKAVATGKPAEPQVAQLQASPPEKAFRAARPVEAAAPSAQVMAKPAPAIAAAADARPAATAQGEERAGDGPPLRDRAAAQQTGAAAAASASANAAGTASPASTSADSSAAVAAASAPAAVGSAPANLAAARARLMASLARPAHESDPAQWWAYLMRLHERGRVKEADLEWIRLHERYPAFQPPPGGPYPVERSPR